jgi:hypothetical protein
MAASQLSYTPGAGANVATDLDAGGAHHQKALIEHLQEGVPTPASQADPVPMALYGEAIEALEALRMGVQALTRTMGQMQPDTAARMRVAIDAISGGLTLATITTVGTLTTLNTLTNQTQIGGLSATEQIPSLMRLGADSLRRNITVS